MNKETISEILYEALSVTSCSTCEFNTEEHDCRGCVVFESGWGISKEYADEIADKIINS